MYYSQEPRYNISELTGIIVGAIIALWVTLALTSCKSKTVVVPEQHTVYVGKNDTILKLDSVYWHDSVFVYSRNETVYKEKYKYVDRCKFVYKTKTDTVIKVDSVNVLMPQNSRQQTAKSNSWGITALFFCFGVLSAIIFTKAASLFRKN